MMSVGPFSISVPRQRVVPTQGVFSTLLLSVFSRSFDALVTLREVPQRAPRTLRLLFGITINTAPERVVAAFRSVSDFCAAPAIVVTITVPMTHTPQGGNQRAIIVELDSLFVCCCCSSRLQHRPSELFSSRLSCTCRTSAMCYKGSTQLPFASFRGTQDRCCWRYSSMTQNI